MRRLLLTTPAALATATAPVRADVPIRGTGGYEHMMGDFVYNGFGMVWGMFFSLVALAAVIVGIVILVRWLSQTDSRARGAVGNATEVLNMRFANGEIDAEEYAQRRKLLNS